MIHSTLQDSLLEQNQLLMHPFNQHSFVRVANEKTSLQQEPHYWKACLEIFNCSWPKLSQSLTKNHTDTLSSSLCCLLPRTVFHLPLSFSKTNTVCITKLIHAVATLNTRQITIHRLILRGEGHSTGMTKTMDTR